MRLLVALLLCLALPASAAASGMTTHSFMADEARKHVQTPELMALLEAQTGPLLSGGAYPDGGYAASSYPGGDFGEATHWERFVNAYAQRLRDTCTDLTDPVGPCAGKVAFLMGIAAHGVGDEMWDWMFEPQARDNGESPVHPLYREGAPGYGELAGYPPGSLANTIEYAMDLVAIVELGRARHIPAYLPPVDDLLAAYAAIGRTDITADGILAGHGAAHAAVAAERAAAAIDYLRVKSTMPSTAARMYDDSGGVADVAQAAAGYYEALWRKLTAPGHPAPRVIATHPEPGERGVPWDWSARRYGPGPYGGGAENRVIAVLSNSIATGVVFPSDGFVLREEATGAEVPQLDSFPRPGPYGNGDGTHSMMLYPAVDLKPCTWYQAVVTPAVRDHAGARLAAPVKWRFQTRSAGAIAPPGCRADADPPPNPAPAGGVLGE